MRLIVILAAILGSLGVAMAQLAENFVAIHKKSVVAAANASASSPPFLPRQAVIARDRQGHFQADARIKGESIAVMVDTGASVVALTESDAARIGIRPGEHDYRTAVTTANGVVKAARVRLGEITVGGITVHDVDTVVLPDRILSESLLGLSYLSRLKRVEFAEGRLILEQ